jgi:redox-sensitive bicupin YhaK (pirin superfamily)
VHSERTPEELRALDRPLHGLQLWVALPRALEESEPSFAHTPAQDLPLVQAAGVSVRVLAGALGDARSPVRTASPTVYLDVTMTRGSRFDLPPLAAELGVYVVQGQAFVNAKALNAHELGVLTPQTADAPTRIEALNDARLAIIGGEPLDAPRYMWWNFVSSRKERIREAAQAWAADRLGRIEGDTERIPLPDTPLR